MPDILRPNYNSQTDPKAIVCAGPVRFSILTSHLIRMEFDPNGVFEDRPTQVFWNRKLPVPRYGKIVNEKNILIETDALILNYQIQDLGFQENSLQIELKETGITWKLGDKNNTNLKGTIRTLDQVNGSISLNLGLISRNGWALINDSQSLIFNKEEWLEPRNVHPDAKDLYFFAYGHNYTDCIIDFQKLSGRNPLLPRFALGNWWSRYWAYHQDELLGLMREFKNHQIPLSVCIVDMDWHITDTGNESSGWTGYTWNRKLFPNPNRFLKELDDLGLKTGLNLHPASGVYPHEDQYETMAETLGVDPSTQRPIPFDIADTEFAQAYFEVLHHPYEEKGVDFWWIDWQQGTRSTIKGLDPLFWLNHLHFYDSARDGKKRPFIFSRWGGLGSQRYPIGFSGDTYVTWECLKFQPYFTATAANVGYSWWSHDIGGHMGGVEEPELFVRWVQYGVFSPILRLHSTNNPYHERRPWGFDAETEKHASNAMRLRHALIPYLYSAAWKNYKDGILPIRPMYHLTPDQNQAYNCPNEYTFGSELIAAPFTTPRNNDTRLSRQIVWLPKGDWFDFFSGELYPGDSWYAIYGQMDKIPVFAKQGAIIPLGTIVDWGGIALPNAFVIHIFPGANNQYQLFEDDGETLAYEQGTYTLTTFKQNWSKTRTTFTITPVEGETSLLPKERTFNLVFHTIHPPKTFSIRRDNEVIQAEGHYNEIAHQFVFNDITLSVNSELVIELCHPKDLVYRMDTKRTNIEHMLRTFKMNTTTKSAFHNKLNEFMSNPSLLIDFADRMEDAHLLALIETWLGGQPEKIADDPIEAFRKIINMIY